MKIYGIKDTATGFVTVIMLKSKIEVLRWAQGLVNGQKSLYSDFPQHFSIFELGEIDQDSGVITSTNQFIEEFANLKDTATPKV